jgi:hypothetical protein
MPRSHYGSQACIRPYITQVYQPRLLLYCVLGLVLQLQHLSATLVFYAPPHGLAAILADMADMLGPHRQAVVARELTKLHEEFFRCAHSEKASRSPLQLCPETARHCWLLLLIGVADCCCFMCQLLVSLHMQRSP